MNDSTKCNLTQSLKGEPPLKGYRYTVVVDQFPITDKVVDVLGVQLWRVKLSDGRKVRINDEIKEKKEEPPKRNSSICKNRKAAQVASLQSPILQTGKSHSNS